MIDDQIAAAALDANRSPDSVKVLAVTKGRTPAEMSLLPASLPFGENKAQELRDKAPLFPEREWHFLGTLQSNKFKYLRPVSLIHTLTTTEQAELLAEWANKWGHAPDVLLQVHNGETQKQGAPAERLPTLLTEVRATGLLVRGLMVMAPADNPEAARATFRRTAQLADALDLPELSMGMSDDFELAIAEGATIIRIGRRLFSS